MLYENEDQHVVAMQLSAKYKKPTIVARLNDQGFDRGSARGLNESDLKDFKKFLTDSGYFEYAQGHANAFGVSIPDASLRSFHEYANEVLKDIDFGENTYDVNFERTASAPDLSKLIIELGGAGGIWGQWNPEPMVHITNLHITNADIRVMGANNDTVKIESNGIAFMKFKAKDFIEELNQHNGTMELEIVGKPNLNEWMGRITPQIFIEECEIKDTKNSTIIDF